MFKHGLKEKKKKKKRFCRLHVETSFRNQEVHYNCIIMQMLENLPDIIRLIIRSSIMPAWHCACVSVISQCLVKLYHRLIG